MENLRNTIFNKLENLQTETPTLNKFFVFSQEEIGNDYEGCLESIEDFLEKNKDKIRDFEFDSWIDSETFDQVLMLKMYLDPSLERHLNRSNVLNNLLPSSVEVRILRERIQGVFFNYSWDFNTEENRKKMIQEIEIVLGIQGIQDRTTPENTDLGVLNFIFNHEGKDLTLSDYLDAVASKKRFEK